MAALDSCKFLHKAIYDKLLLSYNDITNNDMNGFAYPVVEFFQLVGVCNNVANDFDCISSADFSDAMGYLNFHYQAVHRNNKSSVAAIFLDAHPAFICVMHQRKAQVHIYGCN